MVPADGRVTLHHPLCRTSGPAVHRAERARRGGGLALGSTPAWYPATYRSETDIPADGRPGCPRRPHRSAPRRRSTHTCSGSKPPLPERYTDASRRRARPTGSPRPRPRSATGSSSSATTTSATRSCAGPTPGATPSACRCWPQAAPRGRLHRLLRRALHGRVGRHPHRRPPAGDPARPQRRLLDGRHGRHRRGRGGLGGAGPGHRHRAARARSPT